MNAETANQTRLRRARESVTALKLAEDEARKVLAGAVESTKRAREKYEELFLNEQNAECTRMKNDYNHCTL